MDQVILILSVGVVATLIGSLLMLFVSNDRLTKHVSNLEDLRKEIRRLRR